MMIPETVERIPRTEDNFIRTFTGRKFWPLDPRSEDVFIEDIARALSQLCRFTGHTSRFYSVAQHSALVSRHVERELMETDWEFSQVREISLWALLHDASEAYLHDLPSPIKRSPHLGPLYKGYEALVMDSVIDRYGLLRDEPAEVKRADKRMLATEKRDLMCNSNPADLADAYPEKIPPLPPEVAESAFLRRFYALTAGRK